MSIMVGKTWEKKQKSKQSHLNTHAGRGDEVGRAYTLEVREATIV